MADPKIKFKRSAVAGKIPTAAQVPLGELALNTNDGLLYASKDVGAGATVIAVNPFRVGTGTDSYNTFFTAGNVGINSTIPTSKLDVDGDVKLSGVITATSFSGSGASLTNLPAANITGTLPAISGANLTNLNASNLASGTVPTARIPTLNQDTSGTAAGLTGSPTIGVTSITASGTVGIGSTLPSGKLDVAGSVNIKDGTTTSTTTTGGVVFDGSDDILHSNQADSDFTLGSNDFTVEYFVKFDTVGNSAGNAAALILSQLGSISYAPSFGTFDSGSFVFKYSGTGNGWRSNKSLGTVTTGVWYHIAIVRSGNTFYTFQNGVQQATWTESNAVHQPSSGVILGRRANSIHQSALDGTISNVRVVVGTALYTSGFTTPTAELTNVSNTKFLALQSTSSATAATVIPSGVTLSTVSAPAATSSGPGLTASTTVATSGDLHVSGISTFTSDVNVGGGLSVTGNSFFVGVVTFAAGTDGNIVLGDAATDNVVFNADVNSNIVPNTNNAYDLGSSSQKWRNLFISGNANIGGTLTYEDVTNIDSVGLSTFRAGVNITGTATATLFSGSGASLTNLPAANLTGTLPAISGANLTNLDASDLASGTVPDGRFPATLPAISGANLTNLDATNLASGTIPDARFPAALPAIDGSALTGITASGTGAIGGLTIKNQSGAVVGTAGSVSTIDFDGSAGVTVTATTGAAGIATVLISADLVTDTSPQLGGNLDLNGNNITGSGNIPAANLTGALPAISGANLTNLNGSNISSGTVSAARVGALPASKITTGTFADARIPNLAASKVTSGTFDAARIPTLNQDTTGTAALAEGLTGSPTIGVSTITTTGSVGIGSTLPTGKLDVIGQVNIKSTSTTTTSGIATSYTGSVEFDGTGDYLQISSSSDLSSGTGDFTFEAWVYSDIGTSSNSQCIYDNRSGTGSNTTGFFLGRMSAHSGKVELYSAGNYRNANGATFTEGQWNHVAVVRHSNVIKLYLNGIKSGDDYNVTDDYSNTTARIGAAVNGTSTFYGEISNARFVKGTALYKSNFTPQTAELTQVYNTTLLACQSSSSATAEATGKTVTAYGNAAASTTNPSLVKGFDLSGSVDFDGNGDYLSINDSSDFNFGTGDFTIECFIKPDSLNTSAYTSQLSTIFDHDQNAGTTGAWFAMHQGNAGFNWGSNNNTQISATSGLTLGWNHIAVVRSGSTTTVYINGKSGGSATDNHNYTDSSTRELWIGKQQAGVNRQFNGYISNFRIVKGTAIYTAEFSPTFTELTNLPNTKLLALQSASSATAYTVSPGTITAYGDATASSTSPGLISPNSLTGSVQFDGTDDKLTTVDSADYVLLQDFTFEAWAYRTSDPNPYSRIAHWGDYWGNNTAVALTFDDGNNQDKVRFVSYSGIAINSTSDVESNKWYHIAITRSGNTYRMFINGVLEGSTTSSTTIHSGSTTELCIGSTHNRDVEEPFAGHISNVRFVKGTALYTSAFTPPREALTNVTNTTLLCCQSSSSVTEAAVGSVTASSAPVASTTSPGLVKAYTNAGGQTTTTTTTPGNLLVSGITTATNRIDIKSDDSTPGRIDFYCESSNAHYTQLRSAAHSAYSGIATVTLPTSSGTLLLSDGSGASLTNLPAANLTGTLPAISGANLTNLDASDLASGTIPDARFPATLPAISGANLTNLDASDLASGTIPDARFPATLPAISGANLTNVNATIAGISTAGTSTFNHVSVTGVATVSTAFYLPQYTTTARDAGTFNEGAMIYNTTVKKMEFYDGTNWNTLPGVTLGLGMGVF